MKWGQAAAKLEAAMKGNKKESEMELFVAEIIEDDSDVDEGLTFEVGVFDNEALAYEEANKFKDYLIRAFDSEDRRDAYNVYVWSRKLNEGRKEV